MFVLSRGRLLACEGPLSRAPQEENLKHDDQRDRSIRTARPPPCTSNIATPGAILPNVQALSNSRIVPETPMGLDRPSTTPNPGKGASATPGGRGAGGAKHAHPLKSGVAGMRGGIRSSTAPLGLHGFFGEGLAGSSGRRGCVRAQKRNHSGCFGFDVNAIVVAGCVDALRPRRFSMGLSTSRFSPAETCGEGAQQQYTPMLTCRGQSLHR